MATPKSVTIGVAVREQHVVGLDVAVDDAVAVGVGEGVHDLAQELGRLGHRQLALARELGTQRFAGDERHDVVEQVAGGRAGGEQRHDVRVLEPRGELDLALEALDVDGGAGLRRQHLDDDLPAQPGLLGKEDAAHAAAAQLPEEAVGVAEGGLEALLEVGHGPKRSMAVQTEGL